MTISLDELYQVRKEAELIVTPGEIELAYEKMAVTISDRLGDTEPVLITVLTGGIVPAGKLITRLDFPLTLDYLHATRYSGGTTGGEITWIAEPRVDLSQRTVLVVDDILDEGHTLAAIIDYCKEKGAKEVFTAVLADKKHDRRYQDLKADFTGVVLEDRYVFGEGMDYKGFFRNLSGIYAVSE